MPWGSSIPFWKHRWNWWESSQRERVLPRGNTPPLLARVRSACFMEAHSISAGLDYPGVGPEHSFLKDSGRARYVSVDDDEAMEAFHTLCRLEGIIPALESSHAIACCFKEAPTMSRDRIIVVNLSGRGDKDLGIVSDYEERKGERADE